MLRPRSQGAPPPLPSLLLLLVLLALPACSGTGAPGADSASPVQERMFRHFALARDLRSLAVVGDLERMTVVARELVAVEETWGMPPGSEEGEAAVREAARRVADAGSLGEAAFATAELAGTCGSCHVRHDVDLGERFGTSAPYLDDPRVRHQNYLSWASRLLWDGLVGPSERTWSVGAGALVGVDSYPDPEAGHVPVSANREAAAILDQLAAEAVTAQEVRARADLLGRIWETCADCHVQAGVAR